MIANMLANLLGGKAWSTHEWCRSTKLKRGTQSVDAGVWTWRTIISSLYSQRMNTPSVYERAPAQHVGASKATYSAHSVSNVLYSFSDGLYNGHAVQMSNFCTKFNVHCSQNISRLQPYLSTVDWFKLGWTPLWGVVFISCNLYCAQVTLFVKINPLYTLSWNKP